MKRLLAALVLVLTLAGGGFAATAPPAPKEAPVLVERAALCGPDFGYHITVYDTDPGGEGFYSVYRAFNPVTGELGGVLLTGVATADKHDVYLYTGEKISVDELRARYPHPCDVAAEYGKNKV